MLLGWYNPNGGVLEFLQGIMWEFLFPVVLFKYFLIQLDHQYLKANWLKWLYLPFFLTLIGDVLLDLDFIFNLYDSSFKLEDFTVQLFYFIEDTGSYFYNIILIFWSRKLVRKSTLISIEKKRWLLRLNLLVIGVYMVWFIYMLEDIFTGTGYATPVLWALLSFLFWWVLYYGVFKLQIVSQKDKIHHTLSNHSKENRPTVKTKPTGSSKHIIKLKALLEEETIYKNPLLGRQDLAQALGISESHLSNIVNQEFGKNINQVISEYRVDFSKKLLLNPEFDIYAIEAIGMEAGFNSKSVFYQTFKNYTGMTPGAYRKQNKKS